LINQDAGAPAITGLSSAEVQARVAAGQVNTAPAGPGRGLAQILRANVLTPFNAILGTMFVIVLIIGPPQDALFGVVLVVNTIIGVAQELRAKHTLDQLAIVTAAKARAVRDGTTLDIDLGQIVKDDVLDLRRGDQVPVDGVVLTAEGLELDEALLTGEAEPVTKQRGDDVMSGSFAVAGAGWIRATGVGGQAYAVRLQEQAGRFSLIRSELQQGTNQILRLVTWVMIPAGILLILSEFFRSHEPFRDAARGSAAGVVAMVPEGLVLLTSLAFAAGAMRLARRRVLVQELAAIEGLARADVLCIDKTGTLTKPGMQLVETQAVNGWPDARIAEVAAALAAVDDVPNDTMRAVSAHYPQSPGWTVTGEVPFSSARKWSAVSFSGAGTWVLGAPSIVSPGALADEVARHESQGRRVLLLASSESALDGDALPASCEPAALFVLAEELRDDTADSVRYLLSQDITIKVLSGDAPRSVAAIAERAGIPSGGPPVDAAALGDEEIGGMLESASVFGRVRPAQKLAAVKALQAAGHVVAMAGDGVNDVQALKQADLGIAMGSGSQASRSVARIVLLDGSFGGIPPMLAEGRRVIANIERVAGLFVTKTTYAAIIAVAVGIAGVAYPFFPRHLTIISTLTIGVPAFLLALAPGAPRAHRGFAGRVLRFAIPAGTAAAVACLASYGIARAENGSGNVARTAAMLAVFAVGLWVLWLVGSAGTGAAKRLALVVAMAACLAVLFAIPLARRIFALSLPPAGTSAAVAGVAVAAIAALTLWRRYRR
jgi:cation-transporting P-type ATPase E